MTAPAESGRSCGSSLQLCDRSVSESVTGNLHSTTTSAPGASPVVLSTLLVHSSTGLGIPGWSVVLCIMKRGAVAPAPSPSPAPFTGPSPIGAAGAESARGLRVDSQQADGPRQTTEPGAKAAAYTRQAEPRTRSRGPLVSVCGGSARYGTSAASSAARSSGTGRHHSSGPSLSPVDAERGSRRPLRAGQLMAAQYGDELLAERPGRLQPGRVALQAQQAPAGDVSDSSAIAGPAKRVASPKGKVKRLLIRRR